MDHKPVTVITGGAGGIGLASARALAEAGHSVVIVDIDPEALDAAQEQAPELHTEVCDVTDREACRALLVRVASRHGRIDTVWANAGISCFGPADLVDGDIWERVVQVNLVGAYNIAAAAIDHLRHTRGYLAFTSSWAAFAHSPSHSAYSASKAGVEALADSLRAELDHAGVGVGCFHPGWVDTPMVSEKAAHHEAYKVYMTTLPAPFRKTSPVEEVARDLAQAVIQRKDRAVVPRQGWVLYAVRALLPTGLFTTSGRRAAPRMHELFARQAAAEGSGSTAMSDRYRKFM